MIHIYFAYKCKKCGVIIYRNTTRSCVNWCNTCKASTLVRSAKDDKEVH